MTRGWGCKPQPNVGVGAGGLSAAKMTTPEVEEGMLISSGRAGWMMVL